MSIGQTQFLFSIGSIAIYETAPSFNLFSKTTYYWRYIDGIVLNGPFDTIMSTVKDWELSLNTSNLTAKQEKVDLSNVIKIDFTTKKRILR